MDTGQSPSPDEAGPPPSSDEARPPSGPDEASPPASDAPMGTVALLERLDQLGVSHRTIDHPPVFTVEEASRLRGRIPGAHSKNLFVRDKKERHWLVSCMARRQVDLKWLAARLGTKRLTFCSKRRLEGYLGIRPGAVSPFAVINDVGGVVQVALDAELLDAEPLNFHPLDNAKTTAVSRAGLMRFLKAEKHEPMILRFPDAGARLAATR